MKISTPKLLLFGMACCALVLAAGNSAHARPKYKTVFAAKYPALADQVNKVKCGACHVGAKKANRNDYGKALATALGMKNAKDDKAIEAALVKTEAGKSAMEGKTFGDLIKAGQLPGASE